MTATDESDDDARSRARSEGNEMPVHIAVSDPLPVYRRGLIATLRDAGFHSEAPDDLLAWIRQDHRRVVLLTLEAPSDWTLLAELRHTRPDLLVVAVLGDVSVQTHIRAIVAGAVAAVPRDASPEVVRRVFKEAVEGFSVLPVEVVQALAAPHHRPETGPTPAPHEVAWLRELASGLTVAHLAERSGYSERAMFRLLRDLYQRLEVRGRTEALIMAHQRGWL
jgi:DNA-binding NarL/FixJ family response regulator